MQIKNFLPFYTTNLDKWADGSRIFTLSAFLACYVAEVWTWNTVSTIITWKSCLTFTFRGENQLWIMVGSDFSVQKLQMYLNTLLSCPYRHWVIDRRNHSSFWRVVLKKIHTTLDKWWVSQALPSILFDLKKVKSVWELHSIYKRHVINTKMFLCFRQRSQIAYLVVRSCLACQLVDISF